MQDPLSLSSYFVAPGAPESETLQSIIAAGEELLTASVWTPMSDQGWLFNLVFV